MPLGRFEAMKPTAASHPPETLGSHEVMAGKGQLQAYGVCDEAVGADLTGTPAAIGSSAPKPVILAT